MAAYMTDRLARWRRMTDSPLIRVVPSQYPAGRSVHIISGSEPDTAGLVELGAIDSETNDGGYLVLAAGPPWLDLDTIRVETTSSPSWVAWREIEVIAAP